MPKTAMRDADGREVFVRDSGEYATCFPTENIVRRAEGADETKFTVYGFVGANNDYEEQSWDFEDEREARQYATGIYGEEAPDDFERDGEVFEVEVHEVPA